MLTLQDAQKAANVLEKATRIACICHRNPDGDALGALFGMLHLLEHRFPEKTVTAHCADTPVPETFLFLPGALRLQGPPSASLAQGGPPDMKAIDAVVVLDCGEAKLTEMHETHPRFFDGSIPCVNVDHHHGNPGFGTVNLIVPDASSTCEILVHFADLLRWEMTSEIATALLTGVYTDTGGLLHSNTSSEVYRTVARLLRAGARQQLVVTAVFRTAKLSTLKLWGRVLEKISVTEEGAAISAVTEGDFRATGADYAELTGAIDYVNAVPGMRFSMVLSERGGKVKGSLRTLRDDVDVSAMASKLSGGGHKKAAGFAVSGKLKPEVRWKVVEEKKQDDQKKDEAS